ncbi:helix-turn-helix domain-containing protein [Brenneria tiliae]|uniref:AraC family transcriptional regulator n=1 Tax=Brenneria tiliae TaxID=2914984 RepID=A0ABT0MT41_9GAMM|nr:AraC family transcriptional regulator [Brenneria tiliae]MCL2893009.1 AraC family transcriptional regulator [Brenneria tiliae]
MQDVRRFWHLLPVAPVAVLAIMKTNVLDLSLVMIYGGYGIALIYAARGSSSDQPLWQKTTFMAGVYFILSGMADIAIALDLGMFGGQRAPQIIAVAHIATLMVLTFLIVTRNPAPTVISATGRGISAAPPAGPADRALADKLDQCILTNNLYTDPNMTLQRLARRMGIPARQISEAINRVHGRNISQLINGYRIDEARRLLSQTDSRITDIMLACGFQTKSNFNREFLKSTGISPSQWRRANASSESATSVAMPAPESR